MFDKIAFIHPDKKYVTYLNDHRGLYGNLVGIFRDLVYNQQINLRNLLKNYDKEINLDSKFIYILKQGSTPDDRIPFLHFVRIIAHFFVDIDSLIESIKKCLKNHHFEGLKEESNTVILGEVIHFLNIFKSKNIPYQVQDLNYGDDKYTFTYQCYPNRQFQRHTSPTITKIISVNEKVKEIPVDTVNYYEYFLKALLIIKEKSFLK